MSAVRRAAGSYSTQFYRALAWGSVQNNLWIRLYHLLLYESALMPETARRSTETNIETENIRAAFTPDEMLFQAADAAAAARDGHRPRQVDYVNVLALNDRGDAMILQRGNYEGMFSWQVVGRELREGEDPISASKQALLESTGHSSQDWLYLGSYADEGSSHENGVGHYFCAQRAQQVAPPAAENPDDLALKWISKRDLKCGLLDGRIAVLSCAMTISMALLTLPD